MTELEHFVSKMDKKEVKRLMEGMWLDEDELVRKKYEAADMQLPKPVETTQRETARIVASNPSLNSLLVSEATNNYREILITGKVPEDNIDELCYTFSALPINEETRIKKVQTMFTQLTKPDASNSSENGRRAKDDTFFSGGVLTAFEENIQTPIQKMEPWMDYFVSNAAVGFI